MSKELYELSEQDICTRYVVPALQQAGWDYKQFREQYTITVGRVMVRGKLASRVTNPEASGGPKQADFVLFGPAKTPIAVIEAKKARFSPGHGMQQALGYAEMLDVPIAISTNGRALIIQDRSGYCSTAVREVPMSEMPTPQELWDIYRSFKGLEQPEQTELVSEPYYTDGTGREPRYYQRVAIDRTLQAISKNQQRILLVMATGTGKTYTAFQIIWRLRKAGVKKRILFLADRNVLVDQTMEQDFAPFGEYMHKVKNRTVKRNFEIYLALYQAVTGKEEWKQIYRQFPADFFDLVVVDECHRGSASADSLWRSVLEYFSSATHIGLTATPKETKEISNSTYFGDPIYTYSLKQGIEDGFLAPYKVIRIVSDVDALGYTPEKGKKDKHGVLIEQRQYNTSDFDRNLILTKRTEFVAAKVWEYLQAIGKHSKTIIFCDDQPHAERMRQALVNLIPAARNNRRYVMRITGDDKEGKAQLTNFIDNDEPFPVIATTSKLMTTGVDAKTCKLVVLDQTINSMTEFKQIIGRGTRLREDYKKLFFTIMDFKGATRLFSDPDFDGDPVVIYEPDDDEPVDPDEEDESETEQGNDEEDDREPGNESDDSDEESEDEETGGGISEPRKKYEVDDVDVGDGAERTLHLDAEGKLVTESFRVHLKEQIQGTLKSTFKDLDDFLKRWQQSDRKQAIIDELQSLGISLQTLQDAVPNGKDLDAFDLVAHIAFNQKPLTRKERANQVKKRNVFGKYGDDARQVLEALLEKFADHGVQNIENPRVLEMPPFNELGSKSRIRRGIFGSLENYQQALQELENELYRDDQSA